MYIVSESMFVYMNYWLQYYMVYFLILYMKTLLYIVNIQIYRHIYICIICMCVYVNRFQANTIFSFTNSASSKGRCSDKHYYPLFLTYLKYLQKNIYYLRYIIPSSVSRFCLSDCTCLLLFSSALSPFPTHSGSVPLAISVVFSSRKRNMYSHASVLFFFLLLTPRSSSIYKVRYLGFSSYFLLYCNCIIFRFPSTNFCVVIFAFAFVLF